MKFQLVVHVKYYLMHKGPTGGSHTVFRCTVNDRAEVIGPCCHTTMILGTTAEKIACYNQFLVISHAPQQ